MPDIRCPHCGKENPDFLDLCQFCQNPLKPKSTLNIGENPTKKNTGELEGVLPDWLKNARQQSRDSAEEEAAHIASQPKVQKEEPLDLLAGLAFHSEASDEEEVPDWLASINPVAKSKPATPPVKQEPESDFFAQFNKSEPTPAKEPPQPVQTPADRDELSNWLIQESEQPAAPSNTEQELSNSDWGVSDPFTSQVEETAAPKEQEDLSWLHNLESVAKQTDELKTPKSADWGSNFNTASTTSGDEDLSWLNNLGGMPASEQSIPQPAQPSQAQEDLSWLDSLGGTSSSATPASSDDDLGWLNQLGGTPVSSEPPAARPSAPQEDLSWLNSFSSETPETSQPAKPPAQEDLSWLNNLGGTPAETAAQPAAPQEDLSWLNSFSSEPSTSAQPAQPLEDMSWLNNLGGTPAGEPASSQPAAQEDLGWLDAFKETPQTSQPEPASQQDLGWLNSLGGTAPAEPASPQASAPQEDLSWLNAFGETPQASQPEMTPSASQEDMSWLNALGTPAAEQPASTQDDMGWLSNLQGATGDTLSSVPFSEDLNEPAAGADLPRVSPFVPRKTAPLEDGTQADMPDWLKSATEGPSMPMGAEALDQFREDYKVPTTPDEPFSWKSFTQEEQPPVSQPTPAFVDSDLFGAPSQPSTPSADDVNSLFNIEMPDWLSQAEPAREQQDNAQPIGIHAEGGDALAPVDLPSWVQAMRPMDAAISDAAPSIESQPTERDGPLAGFRGVLPTAPLGSARRPQPLSLKLQATDEQQASAAILEQLLAAETSPRPLISSPALATQRALRWVLTGLFILILSGVILLRSQLFTPSALLPVESSGISNIIQGLPENANVLVVVDYEPALAGELEAVSGPLLDQLVLARHPILSFISTSSTGPALVERLMSNTKTREGYTIGQNYSNLGYLAGAETGVLSFIQSPRQAIPDATVSAFSEYSAVIVLTDNADSARLWIEQLHSVRSIDSTLDLQRLVIASSAQAGPLLQPYVASQQVHGLITGLADASRFEFVNNSRPGIARSYWDAFGVGLIMAIGLIALGSLWSIVAGIRARRAETAEG